MKKQILTSLFSVLAILIFNVSGISQEKAVTKTKEVAKTEMAATKVCKADCDKPCCSKVDGKTVCKKGDSKACCKKDASSKKSCSKKGAHAEKACAKDCKKTCCASKDDMKKAKSIN